MSTTKTNTTEFHARWFAPFVGFFDLESIIEPVPGCNNDPRKSYTRKIEKHTPCSYGIVVLALNQQEPFRFELKQGEGIMKDFISFLEKLARDVHVEKQKNRIYTGPEPFPKDKAEKCWICHESFGEKSAVLDHCHYTGKFLGWAHNQCNLARISLNFIPIFAHNLSNYDLHHVILALQAMDPRNTVSIIPQTDEKYISLQIGIWIRSYKDKKGLTKNVYEYIRLLDSFKFMAASLDNLVSNLPPNQFTLLEDRFKQWPKFAWVC